MVRIPLKSTVDAKTMQLDTYLLKQKIDDTKLFVPRHYFFYSATNRRY
jgi:hypothetical protein